MTRILTRSDVGALLDYDTCITAVEEAFRSSRILASGVLGTPAGCGGFHVKAAGLERGEFYYAAKVNANFPDNPVKHGLPTIQGALALFNASDGRLLALMDSIEITAVRTAAATAVATKYLARATSRSVLIIGCGTQGRAQLRALSHVRRIEHVVASDSARPVAQRYASEMTAELGIEVVAIDGYRDAARQSDIIVTCTTSREPLLSVGDVSAGTFIAAVGADNEQKQEIAPDLLASSTLVADVLDQCALIGDLHHALDAGVMSREDVHAELADVVGGRKCGRSTDDEIIIFDSTGTALEDVAAASIVYERAMSRNAGLEVILG
jgi:ornithine cyclodeaminase/alanine dehydrogenase-like protein (mu-crystallin family)